MRRVLLTFLVAVVASVSLEAQILFSDFSDPDVCAGTEGDYWLTASSFQCVPGLPILHSKDLVRWSLVNYAVRRLKPESHYAVAQHGNGVWAPSIRRHGDTYYIYWGDPDFGVFMVKTRDPRGEWDEPVLVMEARGVIDTCPLWDEDGKAYLVNGWANSRCGFNAVLTVRELSEDGTKVIGDPVLVYDGLPDGNHTIEGPKFYKINGYYYILAPAGSVETGWQLALRSKNVYGPYEQKIVFNEDGIHQGGLTDDDNAHFLCFQEKAAYGRILHLLDVEWKDGWPMMKRAKADKMKKAPQLAGEKRMHYQWHANYRDTFGFPLADGGMRVYGAMVDEDCQSIWDVPNLWLRKIDGEVANDTICMNICAKRDGQQSGFVVMGRDYCRIAFELNNREFVVKQMTCKDADKKGKEVGKTIASAKATQRGEGTRAYYDCRVWFKLNVEKGAVCRISYSLDGKKYTPIADTFQAREGKWIGAKYGAYSISPVAGSRGWCDVLF